MTERDTPNGYNPDLPEPAEKKLGDRLRGSVIGTMAGILEDNKYDLPRDLRDIIAQMWLSFQQPIAGRKINLLADTFKPPSELEIDFISDENSLYADVIVNRNFINKLTKEEREEEIVRIASNVNDFIKGRL